MAKIQRFGRFLLLTREDTFALVSLDDAGTGWRGSLSLVSSPSPNDGKAGVQKERRVTAGAVSEDGERVAVCDDAKTLSVWERGDDKSLVPVATHNLSTRSDLVLFVQTPQPAVIVADKSGDVIRFPLKKDDTASEEGKDGEIVLGHLSMLLGVQISPCGNFILTADRDEKVRVSHYPNAYNIHGFCLGHTEFVSGLACLSQGVTATASGDGSIRTWDYANCRQIDARVCHEDAGVSCDGGGGVTASTDDKLKRPSAPGVRSLKAHSNLLAAHIEGLDDGLLLYECTNEGRLEFKRKVALPSPVVDYEFDSEGHIMTLLATQQTSDSSNIFRLDPKTGEAAAVVSSSSNFIASFFSGMGDKFMPQPLDHYYKRWFDNVLTYHENKEKRIMAVPQPLPASKREAGSESGSVGDLKKLCTETSA